MRMMRDVDTTFCHPLSEEACDHVKWSGFCGQHMWGCATYEGCGLDCDCQENWGPDFDE